MNFEKSKYYYFLNNETLFVDTSNLKATRKGERQDVSVNCERDCTISFYLQSDFINYSQCFFTVNNQSGIAPDINFHNLTSKKRDISRAYDTNSNTTTVSVTLGLLNGARVSVILKGNVYNLLTGQLLTQTLNVGEGISTRAPLSTNFSSKSTTYKLPQHGDLFIDSRNLPTPTWGGSQSFSVVTDRVGAVNFTFDQKTLRANAYRFNMSEGKRDTSRINLFNTTGKIKTISYFYDATLDQTTVSIVLGLLSEAEVLFLYKTNVYGLSPGYAYQMPLPSGRGYHFDSNLP